MFRHGLIFTTGTFLLNDWSRTSWCVGGCFRQMKLFEMTPTACKVASEVCYIRSLKQKGAAGSRHTRTNRRTTPKKSERDDPEEHNLPCHESTKSARDPVLPTKRHAERKVTRRKQPKPIDYLYDDTPRNMGNVP